MDKSEINAPNGSEPKINNNVQKDDQDVNKVKDNTVIEIQLVKKTKKNEPKIFPALVLVDKEAFQPCGQENTRFIMKEFWRSANNRIIVAKK